MNWHKEIDTNDVFIFTGLILGGIGLFFWCGIGVALTVVGALLVGMGFFGMVRQ